MEKVNQKQTSFLLVTILFIVTWADLILRTAGRWSYLSEAGKHWAVLFAMLYPLPWLILLWERRDKMQMAVIVYIAFFVAMKLSFS